MVRTRHLFITAAFLLFANWSIHAYRNSVLDPDFLVYGQSVVAGSAETGRAPGRNPFPTSPPPNRNAITLERTTCFGACPAYLLHIDSSGAVSFRQGPPSNRRGERTSTITVDQFRQLVAAFTAVHFFDLNEAYPIRSEDLPKVHLSLTFEGKTRTITHSDISPPGLEELERMIERTANIHRWLHGDPNRFTLQSPVAGESSGRGEDLKNQRYVRADVEARIKPGMTELMQIAGGRDIELRQALQRGGEVNAADETGWTALMIAAVMVQPRAVSALLEAGADVGQKDHHGNTALIGAASIRFGNLQEAAHVVQILLARGASVDARNDLGESALMWAARAGNPDAIKVLLNAGANPASVDRSVHDALYYLRDARDSLAFDPSLVERYNQAESALKQN